jgi:hypothetical protein
MLPDNVFLPCTCGQAIGAGGSFRTRARASERLNRQAASGGPGKVFGGELSVAFYVQGQVLMTRQSLQKD